LAHIPRAVEVIVRKLLAKDPEDRYQTAAGLESDLRYCVSQWERQQRSELGEEGSLWRSHPAAPQANDAKEGHPDRAKSVELAQSFLREISLDRLVEKLTVAAAEHGGAERALLILNEQGSMRIAAEVANTCGRVVISPLRASVSATEFATSLFNQVAQTRLHAVIHDSESDEAFADDLYLQSRHPRSVLCIPIVGNGDLAGALYLEHMREPRFFSASRIAHLEVLASNAADSIRNAQQYAELEKENRELRQAKDELRRSEAFLALAQRMTLTSSCWWSVATGGIVWSEESYRLLDYPRELEPSLALIMQRCHPDDLERLQGVLAVAAESGTDFELKHRLLMPDGSVKHVHVRAQNTRGDAGQHEFVTAIVDRTEQEAMRTGLELALAQATGEEARLHAVISAMPAMAWSARTDGYMEFLSQRWLDYAGLAMVRAAGYGWIDVVHPDDINALNDRLKVSIESPQKSFEVEARLRSRDGEYRWFLLRAELLVDPQGNPKKWYGINTDIEDRKRAESALRLSNIYMRYAQELSHTGSVGFRRSSAEVLWSEETARIYDYDPSIPPTMEMVMRRVHPDDVTLMEDVFARAANGGTSFEHEHRLLMPDGSIKHLRTLANLVKDESGHEEILGAITDITREYRDKARLEEALRVVQKSEDRLRTTLETIPALIWSTQADGWADYFSPAWLCYTGLSIAQASGPGWASALHPDDKDGILDKWIRILESRAPGEAEARFRRFDGEYRWFLFRTAPLIEEGGGVLRWYGTNTDIDDLKRADQAVRRSQIYMEHAQKLSHTGSVGFRKTDGKVLWSEEAALIYGYDPQTPPTMEMVLQRVHPEDLSMLQNVFAQAALLGTSFDFEHRLLMPDGSIKRIRNLAHSVKVDGGVEEVLGAVTDITQQYDDRANLQQALHEIRTSEERLRNIVETIPALTWSTNAEGLADYFSQAWLRYTGLSMEQASGAGWSVAIHPEDTDTVFAQWHRIMASGAQGEAEARFRRFDGTYRWFLFRAAPFTGEDGNVLRWYGTNTDIDDQKRAEKLLASEKLLFEMIATGKPLRATLAAVCRIVEDLTDGLVACLSLPELLGDLVWADPNEPRPRDRLSKLKSIPLFSSHHAVLGSLSAFSVQPGRAMTPPEQNIVERCAQLASIVIERKRAADLLEKSEAFLAEGQKISHTGSFKWNFHSGAVTWSDEVFRIFEFDTSAKLSQEAVLERIHPDDRTAAREQVMHLGRKGLEAEYRLLMPDGSVKHLYVVTQAAIGSGQDIEVVGALMDVTASRQSQARLQHSLDEKEALLKEVHHRVKNNLQLISSLLNLQASQIADPTVSELFAESRNRVRSMALVHENLYRAGDLSRVQMRDHVQTLCAHLVRAYGFNGERIKLETDVEELDLDLDRAISAGLIVNELVSNALKHAFPDGRSGRVLVSLKREAEAAFRLSVSDDGIGLRPGTENGVAESLGLRLVQRLALQLHGKTTVSLANGTSFAVDFGTHHSVRVTT